MAELKGRAVVKGSVKAPAMVASQPFNMLASFSKALIFRKKKGLVGDKNHPFLGRDVKGKIMVIPQTVGSTTGGLVLVEILRRGIGPAGIVCECADSLMASGGILAEVWCNIKMPIIDGIPFSELQKIQDGSMIEMREDGTVTW
ncbi:MAG: aconitase X swivel domain-containing protein [Deltaproteobacteria bacterium]